MLGILLLIYIGRTFYKLAFDYEKDNKWLYPVLAIVTFYAGTFIAGLVIGLIYVLNGNTIDIMDNFLLSIIGIAVGAGFCWGLYAILKYNWEKNSKLNSNANILDDDLKGLY